MPDESFSRREFARLLTAGAVTAPLAACGPQSMAIAADKAKVEDGTKQPEDLLLNVVRRRYPHERLEGEVLEHIRSDIRFDLHRSQVLSDYDLKNADEPAFVFSAWRADEQEP